MKKQLAIWMAVWFALLHPAKADVVIVPSIPYILQNGTTADAAQVMADLNTIISYVNTNAAGNGVNSSITSLTGLTGPAAGAGSMLFAGTSVGGTANAITVPTTYPGNFPLVAGDCVYFAPQLTNTSAVTLNINNTGVFPIKKTGISGLVNLTGGEMIGTGVGTPSPAFVCYNGTNYNLINPQALVENPLSYSNVASAATTVISKANCPNYKCQITGTTTITSFSNAATTGEIYYLVFASTLTLTNNNTSLILPGGVNITTNANDTAQAVYLGSGNWQVLRYTQAIQQFNNIGGMTPVANGLLIKNNASVPSSEIDVTAQSAMLTNNVYTASIAAVNVSVTINLTLSGQASGNDLDTGSIAASTWYYVYIISNGSTVAGLASASSTSPTLPSGYNYYMRVGAMQTDGSNNLYRTRQMGPRAQYVVTSATNTPTMPVLANGNVTVYTATQVTGNGKVFPPTAAQAFIMLQNTAVNSSLGVVAAPNGNYGSFNSGTNPPPCISVAYYGSALCSMVLESNSIYLGSTAGSGTLITASGWVDQVAAN